MRHTLCATLGLLGVVWALPARADVVVCQDDRVLVGAVEELAGAEGQPARLRIRTASGPVVVDLASVTHRVATAVELVPVFRERRSAIVAETPGAADRLARLGHWAKAAGLALEARGCFDDAIALMPDHPEARAGLGHERFQGRWMTRAEAMTAKGFVFYEGRWMLPAEKAHYERKKAADAPAVTVQVKRREYAALAAGALGGDPESARTLQALGAEDQLRVMLSALGHDDPQVRVKAAGRLAAHRDVRVVRALTWQSVRDEDAGVRSAATQALTTLGYDRTPLYFGSALRAKEEAYRVRAAEALSQFSDNPVAPRVLAQRWIEGWGGGPRVNIMIGSSVAYIRDFEVEVAQTAAIADPIVGVIHEAAVLDYQVTGMRQVMSGTESRAYRRGLEQLIGKDLGPEPAPWVEYLNQGGATRRAEGK